MLPITCSPRADVYKRQDVKEIMTSYQYIFDKLFADKEMVAYIVVFTLVILIVYGISRLAVDYSWYIAIGVGTLVLSLIHIYRCL